MDTKASFMTKGELFLGNDCLNNQREPTKDDAVVTGVDPTSVPPIGGNLPPLPSTLPSQGSLGMTQELSNSFLSTSLLSSPTPSTKPAIPFEAKPATTRKGRWSPEEKILFLHGLRLFGKGRWKRIRHFLPMRSLVQIKSHGQKVIGRQEVGEDIFKPLEENKTIIAALVTKALTSGDLPYSKPRNENRGATDKGKQSRQKKPKKSGSHEEGSRGDGKKETGGVAALAAAALWQMSSDQKEV